MWKIRLVRLLCKTRLTGEHQKEKEPATSIAEKNPSLENPRRLMFRP